jgi:hypothetical protein
MPKIKPERGELLNGIDRAVAGLERHIGNWDDGMPADARRDITLIRDHLEKLLIRAGRRSGPDIGTSK